MDINVKVIKDNDPEIVQRLMNIDQQAFGDAGVDEWFLVPFIRHGRVMALQLGGQIIGGAQFIRDWGEPFKVYLYGIAIDRRYRGKGLGTAFLKACIDVIKTDGAQCVELTVDPANHPAVAVYEKKLGFRITEERKDEYGAGENRLVMELKL